MNSNDPHSDPSGQPGSHNAASPSRRFVLPVALVGVALVLLALGIVPRLHAASALSAQTADQQLTTVAVATPKRAPATQEVLLPGAVTAYADAAIYARTSGYVEHWYKDIGATVHKGDVLAFVQTPELNAQLQQAQADAQTAKANYLYAKSTSDRWQTMLKTQSVSAQDAQTRLADMEAKQAMLASAQANVQRLSELVGYESVRAPFDGIVTARNVDVGALVTSGGSPGLSANAGELFHVQQVNTLRIFGDVPQSDAAFVTPNTKAYLTTGQYPGKQFPARVTRDAGSINPTSRTLHVEVDVDNADHALMPGAYVQVHLELVNDHPALDVPVSAILFRSNGLEIGTVDNQNKTVLSKITVGRDFGTHMEVTSGLKPTDRVIVNPSDSITAGETVQVSSSGSAGS